MAGILGDINNNLMGLQSLAQGKQIFDQQQEQYNNNKIASDSLRKHFAALQSGGEGSLGDPQALNEAFLRSPDLAAKMLQGAGITDKAKGRDAADYAIQAAQSIDDPNRFVELTKNRINYLQSQGRDPSHSQQVLDAYLSGDKERVRQGTNTLLASLANQGFVDKDLYAQIAGIQPKITPTEQAKLDQNAKLAADENALKREGLDIQRQGLEIDRIKANAKQAPKPLDASDIKGIQQDVSGLLKDTVAVHRAAKSLEGLQNRASPLSQTAAVFAFMKALDPTSAVRETEQGQVYDAQGAASGIAAKLNKLIGEGGLTKEGFKDIVDTSKALANSAIDSSEQQVNSYLEPYGNTIPDTFKKVTSARIPKRFDGIEVKKERPPLESFGR